jgi:hypothetical protein
MTAKNSAAAILDKGAVSAAVVVDMLSKKWRINIRTTTEEEEEEEQQQQQQQQQ